MRALSALTTLIVVVLAVSGIKAAMPERHNARAPDGTHVRVTAILDGDTLRVEDLEGTDLGRVRLLGINAPEIEHPPQRAECYAEQATRLLEQATPVGSTIEITPDSGQPRRDRYDRMLRYVDHNGTDAALALLDAGAAELYDPEQHLDRGDTYSTTAHAAQDADRGLWSEC